MPSVHRNSLLIAVLLFLVSGLSAQGTTSEEILQSFVESYRTDPMAVSATFGIKVGEEWWTVQSTRAQEAYAVGKKKQYTFHNYGPHEVSLTAGMPGEPTWYFRFADSTVLDKIHDKTWTASTAAAKSTPCRRSSVGHPGHGRLYLHPESLGNVAYLVIEHFWKTGEGEVTRFSRNGSLPSHGAQMVSLYTMKDKRIGWFSLGTEEAANADRGLDKGQVPEPVHHYQWERKSSDRRGRDGSGARV